MAHRSINFAWFIRDYLVWPLFPMEDRKQELIRPQLRYTAAGGTLLISALCGWYFWYSPSRLITRITVYPRTHMVGLRTAAPSPATWLPRALRSRPFFARTGRISERDPNERLVPLSHVSRLQGSAVGSEVSVCNRLVQERITLPPHRSAWLSKTAPNIAKYDAQDALMLRVGDARLAFQLSAAPLRSSVLGEAPPGGVRRLWRVLFKGPTDWGSAPGATLSPAEQAAYDARAPHGYDCEPWFLDRAKFDQVFPLDATRYKKT